MGPGRARLAADGSLPPSQVPALAESYNLTLHHPQTWRVEAFAELLKRGPLMVLGKSGETDEHGNFQPHAIVISGIEGTGDPDNTEITIYDPANEEDAGYQENYGDWIRMMPEATEFILQR